MADFSDEELSVTPGEAQALYNWVSDGGEIDGAARLIRSLGEKTSSRWAAWDTVYRGIRLGHAQAADMLANKPFRMSASRGVRNLEAWTSDIDVAGSFAQNLGHDGSVGAVLKAKPRTRDVLIALDYDYMEWYSELLYELSLQMYQPSRYDENEVLVEYRPGRRYSLCRNVEMIAVDVDNASFGVNSALYGRLVDDKKLMQVLRESGCNVRDLDFRGTEGDYIRDQVMYSDDLSEIDDLIADACPAWGRNLHWFDCDRRGKLRYIWPQPRFTVKSNFDDW